MTTVTLLTPPGVGAIAVLELRGVDAWPLLRSLFRPSTGSRLPEQPPVNRTWFGSLGTEQADEVVVAVVALEPVVIVEIHCHGGRRVTQWLLHQFIAGGAIAKPPAPVTPWSLLEQAPTLRTAAILLDQCHGAFRTAIQQIREGDEATAAAMLARLDAMAPVGRHLNEPWRVVIAGAPNVGKSSLINAIAGFQRSVVSPIAGTTRDVVTTLVALDGWPVELADTAGLRRATEQNEAAGIARAKQFLAAADLTLWVSDGNAESLTDPPIPHGTPYLRVRNKCDLGPVWPSELDSLCVSALTGFGIPELIQSLVARLVPVAPAPGEAVPYTPFLADRITMLVGQPLSVVRQGLSFAEPA